MRACSACPVRTASLPGDTRGMVRNRRPPSRALLDRADLSGSASAGSMMSAACRSARAIRSRGLTFRSSSVSSGISSRNGVRSSTPGSPPTFATRLALAALAVRRAWSVTRPTTMSVRRVPWIGLTSWTTSGLTSGLMSGTTTSGTTSGTAGVSGVALGCASSDTVITPLPEAGRHDVYHRQERFPPGFVLHGDHLSVAVRIVLAHVPSGQGSPLVAGRLGRGRDGRDAAGRRRADAVLARRRRTGLPHQMIILPRPGS